MSSHNRKNYAEWAKDCYSADFHNFLSPHTKSLTGYRCVLCGEEAKITHHAYYTEYGAKDVPGKNLFPLCEQHHNQAHIRSRNWIVTNENDPIRGRFNSKAFRELLARGWEKYAMGGSQKGKSFRPGNSRYSEVDVTRNEIYQTIAVMVGVVILCWFFLQ